MKSLNVGSQLELVADPTWIECLSGNATLILHHPQPRDLITVTEDPEHCPYRYMTVFQDRDEFKMYYGLPNVRYENKKKIKSPERICLATSKDGINWEKPSLNLISYRGSTDNNIVWMEEENTRLGVGGFSPFIDTNPDCSPDERYKAVAEAGPIGKKALEGNGLFALASSDGLHWRMMQKSFIMTGGPGVGAFDSQNLAFWDSARGEYRMYRREVFREGPLNVFRDILTATSTDFLSWSSPERLAYPGALPEQLYTNNVQPYERAPHLLVGFPARYVERPWSEALADLPEVDRRRQLIKNSGSEPTPMAPTEAGGQRIGTALTDTVFMSSRDRINFHRWGEAFIRPGLREYDNWFYADNFKNWGLITTPSQIPGAPDELSFYVTERSRHETMSNRCRRYTLRMDGFVSVQGGRSGGEIITCPLQFSGTQLFVNFSASAAGSLRIEIQTDTGEAMPGYSAEDCIEVLGDALARKVRWKNQADLSRLAGKTVKLRFLLNDADLFAFQFK